MCNFSTFPQNHGLDPSVVDDDSDRVVSHGDRRRTVLEVAQTVRVGRSAQVPALVRLQAAAAVLARASRKAVPAAVAGLSREAVPAGPPEAVQAGSMRTAQSGFHAGRGLSTGNYIKTSFANPFLCLDRFEHVVEIFDFHTVCFSSSTSPTRPRFPTSRSSRCVTGTTYSTTRTISQYSRTLVSIRIICTSFRSNRIYTYKSHLYTLPVYWRICVGAGAIPGDTASTGMTRWSVVVLVDRKTS